MVEPSAFIRDLRTSLGWSQETLATRSGLNREAISKIERGSNKASSYATREALARGFGLTLDQLVAYLEGRETTRSTLARITATVPTKGAA